METATDLQEKSNQQPVPKVSFPWGVPGLESSEYTLSIPAQDMPFYFLRSMDKPEEGLLLINPFQLFRDYEFEISEEVTSQLEITDEKQVAVLCTVNTSGGLEKASVNLMAPIVINTENMLAKQVVLHDSGYSLRQPLILKMEAQKEAP